MTCYACQVDLRAGDEVAHLKEADGTEWTVHVACLETMFEPAEPTPDSAEK